MKCRNSHRFKRPVIAYRRVSTLPSAFPPVDASILDEMEALLTAIGYAKAREK